MGVFLKVYIQGFVRNNFYYYLGVEVFELGSWSTFFEAAIFGFFVASKDTYQIFCEQHQIRYSTSVM